MVNGSKIKLNRILCSPCTIILSFSQRLKTKEMSKRPTIGATLPAVMTVIFLLLWISSHYIADQILSTVTKNLERSVNSRLQVDESFLLLYKTGITQINTGQNFREPFMDRLNDKFSHANFLHLKLRHLVALSYLSSPYYGMQAGKPSITSPSVVDPHDFLKTNFSFLLNDLNVVLKVQNFYLNQWGCHEIESMKFPNPLLKTQHSMTGNTIYNGRNIALQTSVAEVDELMTAKCGSSDSDGSQSNLDRCFLLKNRRMLQQYLFLQELSHPNIVKPFGVCISYNSNGVASAFVIAKEAGITIDLAQLKSRAWNQRLKICYDLVDLAHYLSRSPFGSIMLEDWSPKNFVITPDSFTIKLSNFDQKIWLSEKTCKHDSDCSIEEVISATKCMKGICRGYNEKVNLHNIYKFFVLPILENDIPTHISDDAKDVFKTLKQLQCNSTRLLQLLQFLQPLSQNMPGSRKDVNKALPLGGINRLPDGSQVDSWEQHESHVPINEVDFNLPKEQNDAQQDINNVGVPEEEDNLKATFGYKKIENADYPGRYDYYCPHSKAEWGCVVSMRKLEEAAKKCDTDAKCKAFVTMPHLRKEGWIIVILKSDNTRAVDHAGTTVYIKASDEIKSKSESAERDKGSPKDVVKLCLQDLVQAQEVVREKREKQLMKPCGWEDMSDSKWQSVVLEATVKDANTFKPSRGKMAVGGQMNVLLEASIKVGPALFLAKRGPQEYHLAQLTAYHLDRMLGLYKIVPAFLRTLTEQEMADAGFPVDIGGNQFDVFRQLKNTDKSLSGTIVPTVSDRIGVEHYISVPKLSQITNAVTPFSRRQWGDLEYLLLMWLASLPMPTKGHPSLQGHLIHVKADEAFKSEPAPIVLQYFYNCQFPRIAVDVLRNLRATHCNFGDQLVARVRTAYPDLQQNAFSFQVPVADIATRNANRLLEVVDLCVRKFGDSVVLYDS